jgi:hypothetical protein
MRPKMTPKEAAHAANTGASGVQEFLVFASPSELEEFCHGLDAVGHGRWFHLGRIALDVRIAGEQAESAKKLERYTRWLIGLTVALVAFALVDFFKIFFGFCH